MTCDCMRPRKIKYTTRILWTAPRQVRFIKRARIVGGKSKPKSTVSDTAGISNADVDTFANAHRPTAEADAFDAVNSFGAATIVRQANVDAVCCMKENRPTVQCGNAQLIYIIVACSKTININYCVRGGHKPARWPWPTSPMPYTC